MEEMKALITAQQGELDAVVMYKALAEKMKDENDRKLLLKLAADEGRHAAILKGITGQELRPQDKLAKLVCRMVKITGKKCLFFIMAKVEAASYNTYKPLFEKYPQTKEIADDEVKHGKMLRGK